jgi:cholest-4-en-3-one 26-monooxygenase
MGMPGGSRSASAEHQEGRMTDTRLDAPADFDLETIDIISNDRYAQHGYPHAEWAFLRREAPVWYNERHVRYPFWAVTRHADILALSKQPERFRNGPRIAVFPQFAPPPEGEGVLHHLLNMDPPKHGRYRKLVSHMFTPRGLGRMTKDIEGITKDLLDAMAGEGGEQEGDFVSMLSGPLPLQVLAELLGVPRDMWAQMFDWTNQTIGSADPDYQIPGETPQQTGERARIALFEYFGDLARERRKAPREDMISVLANAKIDGQPLSDYELLSYYFLIVVAGNETTRNAMTGGLQALIENPAEWAKLKADPGLVDSAVEEIVRWVSPVIQFCRTPIEDVELHGQKIRAGENLCLFYPSANRDERVFDEPFAFRVDRTPNRHLGFGIGEHFCLGANLARLELRVYLRHLIDRLEHVEQTGEIERLASSLLGGIKRMPIRYVVRPS